jgi:hypothetical protein
MHRRFLLSQTAEQNAKIAAIDRQVAQKRAERATIKASIKISFVNRLNSSKSEVAGSRCLRR